MSIRFDRANLNDVERLPDGRLRVKATFSRVGPLNYLRSDGSLQTEIVTAEELFKADSLETAGLAPVTLNHPPEGFVTPKNWKKYAVGASGSTVTANRQDGLVNVVFVIGDEDAIEAVESGRCTEVSAGYSTTVEQRSDGQHYQTNRIYNHLALVERGRAGPSVRLHLDSDDWAVMANENLDACGGKKSMKKWKGMDVEESVFDKIMEMEEEMKAMKSDMKGMKEKKDSLEANRIESLEGQLAAYQTKVDALESELASRLDASAVAEAAQSRLDAYTECQPFLPEGCQFDAAMTPMDWRRAAIAHVNPSLQVEGRSDDFVNGMFSTLQVVGTEVKAKADEVKADDFRRVLEGAATAGHSGRSLEKADDDREDADLIANVNKMFAFDGGSN